MYQVHLCAQETLGTIALVIMDRIEFGKTKRIRKQAFREFEQLARLSKIFPHEKLIHAGRGCDHLGDPVFLLTFEQELKNETEL